MRKPLKYLVIHCTATPAGKDVSIDDIRRWHTLPVWAGGRGWEQVGYTDLIHIDGRIERLVDNNEDNWVDPWERTNGVKGHNDVSRHVVYAGGLASDAKTSCDTRTLAQREAMAAYVLAFHARFPGVRIVGHRDLADTQCPGFDVSAWLKTIGVEQDG